MRPSRLTVALTAVAGACALTLPPATSALANPSANPSADIPRADIRRVSVASDGAQADARSFDGALSADGRTVVFYSEARNLLPGAAGDPGLQLYAKDLRTGRVDLVSANPDGTPGYQPGYTNEVSANGRFVVFDSPSRTLDPRDANPGMDIFVRDRWKGTTELITRQPAGAPKSDNFLPSLSANGRYIAFTSTREDLVPQDTNKMADVFVHDRRRGTTRLVSVASDGTQGTAASSDAAISDDGRRVAFVTAARNLFPWPSGARAQTPPPETRRPRPPYRSLGVHDLRTGRTVAGAVNPAGIPAEVSYDIDLSPDGRYVLFSSNHAMVPGDSTKWWSFYGHDLRTGRYLRLGSLPDGTQPTGTVHGEGLSADNRTAYFTANASNFVPDDTNDTFARDLAGGKVTRLSTKPDGSELAEPSYGATVDRTGRLVAFNSDSPELVPGDTNGVRDVFVRRQR